MFVFSPVSWALHVVVKVRQIPDSADSRRLWSSRVDRPVMSLQMCQKASEGLGENLQVSKERADRLSFKAACHSQTEASPVWLTQRQCTVTSPLLRPHYLVESATVEEEQPQGTMKYLVERPRQQEVVCKVLKGTASNYWRITKNLVLWFHNVPSTTVILVLKEQCLL